MEGFLLDVNLYRKYFYRFRTEVWMGNGLHFKSVIRHYNSAAIVIFSWIAASDNQRIVPAVKNAITPVCIYQTILFFFSPRFIASKYSPFTASCNVAIILTSDSGKQYY